MRRSLHGRTLRVHGSTHRTRSPRRPSRLSGDHEDDPTVETRNPFPSVVTAQYMTAPTADDAENHSLRPISRTSMSLAQLASGAPAHYLTTPRWRCRTPACQSVSSATRSRHCMPLIRGENRGPGLVAKRRVPHRPYTQVHAHALTARSFGTRRTSEVVRRRAEWNRTGGARGGLNPTPLRAQEPESCGRYRHSRVSGDRTSPCTLRRWSR